MDIKPHTRRAPQPPIDAALVLPGARFPKNRAIHIGKPPVYDIVQRIEQVTDSTGTYDRVHYVNSETGRKGSMPMRDFCSAAEHRLPDPEPLPIAEETAPDSGVQVATQATLEERVAAIDARQREMHATVNAIHDLLRNGAAGPLFSRGTR